MQQHHHHLISQVPVHVSYYFPGCVYAAGLHAHCLEIYLCSNPDEKQNKTKFYSMFRPYSNSNSNSKSQAHQVRSRVTKTRTSTSTSILLLVKACAASGRGCSCRQWTACALRCQNIYKVQVTIWCWMTTCSWWPPWTAPKWAAQWCLEEAHPSLSWCEERSCTCRCRMMY